MRRESNIELLRIVAMLFIIAHHYALHGGVYYGTADNLLLSTVLVALGKLGVNLFVLITGYFMIWSSFKIMRIIRLEAAVLFYSIGMYLIAVFVMHEEALTFLTAKASFFPTLMNNGLYYWFIPCYMGLLLISPYINKLMASLARKQFEALLIILVTGISVIPTLMFSAPWYDGNMFVFILLYLLGGYIRKYDIGIYKITNKVILFMSVLLYVILVFLTVFIRNRMEVFSRYGIWPERLWECASIFIIDLSLMLFIFFKRLKVKYHRIINSISSATIGVYLLHDNRYVRMYIWKNMFHTENYINSDKLIYHAICCIIIVFVTGTLIELVRSRIMKPILEKIEKTKLVKRIDAQMNILSDKNENVQ